MEAYISNLLLLTLRLAIPITLAAIGGTFSERSGIINLGLEGMMLIGALGGVLGVYYTGEPWLGVLFSLVVGGLIGGVHAVLSIKFKANQVVCGVGINLLAAGLTAVLVKAVWNRDGMSGQVESLKNITIPLLNKIPVAGVLFRDQSPYLYITLLVVAAGWYIMFKTKTGLRIRAIGDHPRAAETAGININKYRYICVILSGMLAGIAGAYLSIAQNNLFINSMVAGRGFMALAANIFGGWNSLGSFIASLIFAFTQAIRLNLSSVNIPDQFIQMIPYATTLLVLIVVQRKAKAPEALGDMDK